MRQDWHLDQRDVVCKITPALRGETQPLQSPRFAPELSCCWQDGRRRDRPARPVRRNALGPELRCCLQDRAAAACGPGVSAAGDYAQRPRDAFRGTASSNRDGGHATSGDCPGTPRDIPDRRRSSPGGNLCDAFAGTRLRYRPSGGAGTLMVGKPAGNSGNAVHPYGRCRIRPADLETAVESYRVPANASTTKPAEMRAFLTGDNTRTPGSRDYAHRMDNLHMKENPTSA